MEYMSREDYCEENCGKENRKGYKTCTNCGMLNVPTADVQPVKHGKWKHVAGMNSKCSVCSHYFPVTEFDSRPFDINFCPNCGARMGLKED